jgi:DNA-binding MarR family transcriptional regulator
MSETTDIRQVVAERLALLGMLQLRSQRRDLIDGQPWRDPHHGQGRVLAMLKMQPEITQRELTYLLGMSRAAMAQLLGKLEKQGLIEREPSTDDKRVVTVRLTEAGRAAEQSADDVEEPMAGLLDALSQAELATFADYLGRLIARFEEESGEDLNARRARIEELWATRGGDPRTRGAFPGYAAGAPRRGGFPGRPGGMGGFGAPAPEGMPGAERFAAGYDGPMPDGRGGFPFGRR